MDSASWRSGAGERRQPAAAETQPDRGRDQQVVDGEPDAAGDQDATTPSGAGRGRRSRPRRAGHAGEPQHQAAAANASVYWLALKTARQGACRSRTDGDHHRQDLHHHGRRRPQPSSRAKVKVMDGKTVAIGARPGAFNGRASTITASAAISQKLRVAGADELAGRSARDGIRTATAASTTTDRNATRTRARVRVTPGAGGAASGTAPGSAVSGPSGPYGVCCAQRQPARSRRAAASIAPLRHELTPTLRLRVAPRRRTERERALSRQ